jgi:hypothetical protein
MHTAALRSGEKPDYVRLTIILLAVFNVLLHLITSYNLEYHRDELLYFSLGRHPAFGYATVPPLTGWMALIAKTLFGNSLFSVRIFPSLGSALMVFLVAGIAKELGGSGYSRILAATGIFISIIGLRTFLMFQPVYLDLIFWTLSFYLLIKFINTGSGKYLILFGLFAGVALLNKYLIGLLFGLIFIIAPFTPHRSVFRNRNLWYGILAGFLVFLPNLVWQAVHHFPVVNHMAELERTQLVHVSRLAFLREQLFMPGFASFLTVAGIIYLLIAREAVKFRFLALVALSVIIVLMLLHGKNYYTQGIFPMLMAAGAVSWEKTLRRRWQKLLFILLLVLLTIPVIPIGVPVYRTVKLVAYFEKLRTRYGMDFVTRFEDNSIHSLPQDYADMLGWEELTAITARAWDTVQNKKAAFIYGENYGQAGAITVIGQKYGLPEAVCFNESFRYWIPRSFDPDITTMIYINDEPGDDVKALFRKISVAGKISNPDAREFGTTVYVCQDPVESFNKFWSIRIKELN